MFILNIDIDIHIYIYLVRTVAAPSWLLLGVLAVKKSHFYTFLSRQEWMMPKLCVKSLLKQKDY